MKPRPPSAPYALWCAAIILALPLVALGVAVRWARGKGREGLRARLFGTRLPAPGAVPRLWVHACSVGEVAAAAAIVRELRQRRPEVEVVLSVITAGGFEAGERTGVFTHVCYAPLDLPVVVRRFVRRVAPDVFVDIETELWPVLLHQVARQGIPMLLLHGRISDRSIGGYRRIRAGTRWMLRHFDRLLAQSRRDADRLLELGAPAGRVAVVGNAKYDGAPRPLGAVEIRDLRQQFGLGEDPVWVVGSTRTAAEEREILAAFSAARRHLPSLRLVLAPRHVNRVPEVIGSARASGIDAAAATEGRNAPCQVVDTMGILARLYAVGAVAFVGNSLVPPGGGQNLIEPLAQGIPVLVGPWTWEFQDVAELALGAGVAWRVRDAQELADAVVRLAGQAADPGFHDRAVALVDEQRGAAGRYAAAILEVLPARGQRAA